MQALFFEVLPRAGHESHYFERAAALRPELEKNPGLITIDRFMSVARPGLILSHSLWEDEASLAKWRSHAKHQAAQAAGRNVHFADYRLRIAQVINVAMSNEPLQTWQEHNPYNDPALVAQRYLVAVESTGEPFGKDGEGFKSVNRDDAFVSIIPVGSKTQGDETVAAAVAAKYVSCARLCLVSRDYGMYEREEAPQYFSPIEKDPT